MVLVNSQIAQETPLIVDLVQVLAQNTPVSVTAAAHCSSVTLAELLADRLKISYAVDGNWDGTRDQDYLDWQQTQLLTTLKATKVNNLAENAAIFQDENQVLMRIQTAIFTNSATFRVILLPESSICHAIRLISGQNRETLSAAEVKFSNGFLRVEHLFENTSQIVDFLLSTPLKVSHNHFYSSTRRINFDALEGKGEFRAETDEKNYLKPLELTHSQEIPERICREIRKMMDIFRENLRKTLNFDEYQIENTRKLEEIKGNFDQKLVNLEIKLNEVTSQLHEDTKSLEDARNALKAEIFTLNRDLENAVSSQKQVKRLIATVMEAVPSAVQQIHVQIECVERELQGQKKVLEEIVSQEKTGKKVFVLKPVVRRQDTMLTIHVTNTKAYFVPGTLLVSHVTDMKRIALDISKGHEVELGSILNFVPGEYTVKVVAGEDSDVISNEVRFEVDETQSLPRPRAAISGKEGYLASFLYNFLGTIQEIELKIARESDQSLAIFRKLATEWRNSDSNLIQTFIDTCQKTLSAGEARTREALEAAGFEFTT